MIPRAMLVRLAPVLGVAFIGVAIWLIALACTDGTGALRTNDFHCFYDAAVASWRGLDIYTYGKAGYIYPPLLAALMTPLAWVDTLLAAAVWKMGGVACGLAAGWLSVREARRRGALEADRLLDFSVLALGTILLADRLRSEINDGQTDFLLVIPFILALGWLGRRPVLAGVALGFAFHIKYLAIVFLPYLIIRGRWREAGAMVASIVGWALVSAPVFGWSRNLDYLAVAGRGMVRMTGVRIGGQAAPLHGIEWNSSVSIPSAMARAARSLDAGPGFVLAASAMVALLTFGAAWLVYLRAGVPLFRGRTPARDDADPGRRLVVGVEWCGLIVAALAFSPQTMARHMIILYPMTFFTLTLLLRGRPGWTRGPLLAGYWLATLAIILPPGGVESFKAALTVWRGVGGASWTLLAYFLAFLWSGLREAGGIGRGLPAGPHPGMNPQIPSTLGVVQVQQG